MLVRLLYASKAVDTDRPTLAAVVAAAQKNNALNGITGVLVLGGGIYLQVLEGGRQAVSALLGRLYADPRHQDVQLLHFEEVEQRRFGTWAMGVVDVGHVNAGVLLKHSERAALDPAAVSGKASVALVEDLMATASVVAHV